MRFTVTVGVVGVVCLLLMPALAGAQGTSAASVTGVVKDASGAILPGVTVEAASPALIEKVRTTITDEKGEYRIIELRPGIYSVTYTLPGFSTFKRDELELRPSFTATLNVEMKVGGLEETVTVSGQTPLVDTQNITQQKSMSKELLDTVPTSKSVFAFASLIPSAVAPTAQQDVGGSVGEQSMRLSVHGAKAGDARLLIDGLSYNSIGGNGTGRWMSTNPLSNQEIVVELASGGSAEYGGGGAITNLISRDGGNQFSGTIFATGSTDALQGNNFTDDLKAQGLTSVNQTLRIYDLNGVVGGPIIQDKLWFKTAHRRAGSKSRVGNLYQDANWGARTFGAPAAVWKFAPDPSRPVDMPEDNKNNNVRLSWQAAATHKITFAWDYAAITGTNNNGTMFTGTLAQEADSNSNFRVTNGQLVQMNWTHAASNKLLYEASFNVMRDHSGGIVMNPNRINIRDTLTNFTYNGVGNQSIGDNTGSNQRFSMSYVSGAHNFKAGTLSAFASPNTNTLNDRGTIPFQYTFNNGVPTQLTEWVSPYTQKSILRLSLGLFAQDQWKINRMTLNLGLRYEYLNAYAPLTERPAGQLQDATTFPEVDCLPCWHDLYPRAAVAYDLFGNGKTALKASIGLYGGAVGSALAGTFGPIASAVNSTNRAWTDTNGNFYPDCDLRNPAINGECQAMANQSFGQIQVRTRPDPDWITGFGQRVYNWAANVSLEHELRPGVAVSGGYYRTWFGNFTIADNQFVTPANYTPYCVPAPTDARLGSISGSQVCGLADINPDKFGQVDSIVTLSSHYGKQTEVYNGADLGLNVRLPHGAQISGGWNIGNSVSLPNNVSLGMGLGLQSSKANSCFVVDSPQQLYNCETGNPYQNRIKFHGSYPLPWDFLVAAVFQSLPGAPYQALNTYTTAQIQPSLGRPLSGGTRTVTIDLLPVYSAFREDRVNQVDVRLSKIFRLGKMRIQGNLDVFNALNSSVVLQVQPQMGATWLQPTQIIDARLLKLGVQLDF